MIQINLLRISPDSQYLEFSVECPTNYQFNTLRIKKYDYLTETEYPANLAGWVEAGHLYKNSIITPTKEVMRISTSLFGEPTMFYVEFGVEWTGGIGLEPVPCTGVKLSDPESNSIGVCSNVNGIYDYLLTEITSLDTNCPKLTMEIKQAYVFLYSHTEAMRLNRYGDAEYFYGLIKNNFSNCGTDVRNSSEYRSSCNC